MSIASFCHERHMGAFLCLSPPRIKPFPVKSCGERHQTALSSLSSPEIRLLSGNNCGERHLRAFSFLSSPGDDYFGPRVILGRAWLLGQGRTGDNSGHSRSLSQKCITCALRPPHRQRPPGEEGLRIEPPAPGRAVAAAPAVRAAAMPSLPAHLLLQQTVPVATSYLRRLF